MSLVKVWTDIGAKKHVQLLAKIIEKDGVILIIKYLSEGKDHIWRYEDDTYEIDDSSIAEYLKTDDECDIGFIPMGDGGFVKDENSDDDYEPSDEEEDEDEEDEDEDEAEDEDPDEEEEFTEDEEEEKDVEEY
jgi:cobalamin biosynthesis protein CobT